MLYKDMEVDLIQTIYNIGLINRISKHNFLNRQIKGVFATWNIGPHIYERSGNKVQAIHELQLTFATCYCKNPKLNRGFRVKKNRLTPPHVFF